MIALASFRLENQRIFRHSSLMPPVETFDKSILMSVFCGPIFCAGKRPAWFFCLRFKQGAEPMRFAVCYKKVKNTSVITV